MPAMVGARAFSLAAGRASGGVYCAADGVFVGDVPLLQRAGAGGSWQVRPLGDVNDELTARYRLPIDITAKANALALIAHALNRDDLAMAAIATVQMQLPDPPLANAAEAHDQIMHRAAELRRIGLLKFWDPAKHPRTGTAPNPGWFAPIEAAGYGALSVQATSQPAAVQVAMNVPGERKPPGDTSDLPTGGGGGGGTVRLFGPGGLFGGPPDYRGGPNVIRPLPEGGESAHPGEAEPGLPPPSPATGPRPRPEYTSPPGVSSDESLPAKIGSFPVPHNLTYGTTLFGNYAHEETAKLLRELYPDVKFILRVGPGQKGIDVEVPEGSIYLDIKPRSPSGERKFYRQLEGWGVPVQPLTYDKDGNIYYGFR